MRFREASWTPVNKSLYTTPNSNGYHQNYGHFKATSNSLPSMTKYDKICTNSKSFQQIDQFKQQVLESSSHELMPGSKLQITSMQNDFLKDVVGNLLETMKNQSAEVRLLSIIRNVLITPLAVEVLYN